MTDTDPPSPTPAAATGSKSARVGQFLVSREADAEILELWPRSIANRVSASLVSISHAAAPAWQVATTYWTELHDALKNAPELPVVPVRDVHSGEDKGSGQFSRTRVHTDASFHTLAERFPSLPAPPETIERIARDLARALDAIGSAGILHLDLCLETVVLAGETLKLARFSFDTRPFIRLRRSHMGYIRPGYSPIEQYDGSGASRLSPATDIHAASALLFHLATGEPPPPWLMRRGGWGGLAALPAAKALSPALVAAIDAGLTVNPASRPGTVREWASFLRAPKATPSRPSPDATLALDSALESRSFPLTGVEAPHRGAVAIHRPKRRFRTLVAGLLVLMISAISIAAYFLVARPPFERPGPTPSPSQTIETTPVPSPTATAPQPRPSTSSPAAAIIDGTYRASDEADCSVPRSISINGDTLSYRRGDFAVTMQITQNTGGHVAARDADIGQEYDYEVLSDGVQLRMTPKGGEPKVWIRCPATGPTRADPPPNSVPTRRPATPPTTTASPPEG